MAERSARDSGVALRDIAMAALARTTGSPLVEGNAIRILQDGPENHPAWEEAIEAARRTVHMEMYIFRAHRWGGRFAALLARRAAAGVRVRLLCDWFGSLTTPRRLFRDLIRNGGEGLQAHVGRRRTRSRNTRRVREQREKAEVAK